LDAVATARRSTSFGRHPKTFTMSPLNQAALLVQSGHRTHGI
jgi:hypothetical protein